MRKIIKKLFSDSLFNKIRRLVRSVIYSKTYLKFKYGMIKVISSNIIFSKIYYLFSTSYSIEQECILKGRAEYLKKYSENSSLGMLRRNIHRIEKGLIMRPRREVYGLDYLSETVNCFLNCYSKNSFNDETNIWAKHVLDRYFSVSDKTNKIVNENYLLYKNHLDINLVEDNFFNDMKIPSSKLNSSSISFNELENLTKQRSSVRWFSSDEFPNRYIDKAISLALTAPSACNRQPFRFIVIDSNEVIQKVSKLAGGTAGFSTNINKLIVLVGDLSNYEHAKDRHVVYIDSSLSAMQFCLGIETLGGSTCCINWPENNFSNKKIKSIVGLDEWERTIMLIAVGYEDKTGLVPYSQKKSVNDVRTFA